MNTTVTIEAQEAFWSKWDTEYLDTRPLDRMSRARGDAVLARMKALGIANADILEVGCGNGWFAEMMRPFGRVTATDLATDVIAKAQQRLPQVRLLAGDFLNMDFAPASCDLVVTMETLSHVVDQPKFIAMMGAVLRPGGYLMITTQNRFVFERRTDIKPKGEGQLRNWLDPRQVRALLRRDFDVVSIDTLVPAGQKGILRIANSYKLNRVLSALVGQAAVDRFKEWCGFGQTIVAVARRR